jgi:thiol-disulfide isomerase/thioredoxin
MYVYAVVLILLVAVYYLWNKSNNLKVYWFYKPECKYCKKMEDEWQKVEDKLCGSGIICKRIDITEPRYKKIKDNFNFKTVPHIVKINLNGTRDVFDGTRKCDDIISWIYENYE